jgi:hypothetical protein
MSPGWHRSSLQIASSVENLIAFALLVFNIDKLAFVIPTLSARSDKEIFRFAIITSRFTIIAMFLTPIYIVKSFSSLTSMACLKTFESINVKQPAKKKIINSMSVWTPLALISISLKSKY